MRDTAANHQSAGNLTARLFAAVLLTGAAIAPPLAALAASSVPTPSQAAEANQTRVLAWTGGDRLSVAVSADVDYIPGADAKVVVTGPSDKIRDIVVDHGVIKYANDGWHWFGSWGPDWTADRIKIVVTAPRLSAAHIGGSGRLNIGRLAQDRLDLSVSGSGSANASGAIKSLNVSVSGSGGASVAALTATDLTANLSGSGRMTIAGSANSLKLRISGSGRADMTNLALQDVVAGLSGSGSASIAPKGSADIGVSGSGDVRLVVNPAQLNTHKSGSGRIIRPDGSNT